jgi:glycosyltransferase involved in cell wall biosynthesis
MTVDSSQAIDSLFAQTPENHQWRPHQDDLQIIEQIDEVLDLIAEGNTVASGARAIDHIDVTIIVPVYNERKTLPDVLRRIDEVMPAATETIIVDDASTDGTGEWLEDLESSNNRRIFRRRRNHGKGSAVRLAIRPSRGRVIAIQDADLEYDPADLLRVIWPIIDGKAEVVYGSRYVAGSSDPSLLHRLGNYALTRISNCLTGLRLTDMETCHKAFDGNLLRSIPLCEPRFGFEPEITAKVASRRARILEVPTGYQCRGYEEGKKIGWRDAFDALVCMWIYRKA